MVRYLIYQIADLHHLLHHPQDHDLHDFMEREIERERERRKGGCACDVITCTRRAPGMRWRARSRGVRHFVLSCGCYKFVLS